MPIVGHESDADQQEHAKHPSIIAPHGETEERQEQNEEPAALERTQHHDREEYRTGSEQPPAGRSTLARGSNNGQREEECHDLLKDDDRIPRSTHLSPAPVDECDVALKHKGRPRQANVQQSQSNPRQSRERQHEDEVQHVVLVIQNRNSDQPHRERLEHHMDQDMQARKTISGHGHGQKGAEQEQPYASEEPPTDGRALNAPQRAEDVDYRGKHKYPDSPRS